MSYLLELLSTFTPRRLRDSKQLGHLILLNPCDIYVTTEYPLVSLAIKNEFPSQYIKESLGRRDVSMVVADMAFRISEFVSYKVTPLSRAALSITIR